MRRSWLRLRTSDWTCRLVLLLGSSSAGQSSHVTGCSMFMIIRAFLIGSGVNIRLVRAPTPSHLSTHNAFSNANFEIVELTGGKLFHGFPPGVVTAKTKDAILSGILLASSACKSMRSGRSTRIRVTAYPAQSFHRGLFRLYGAPVFLTIRYSRAAQSRPLPFLPFFTIVSYSSTVWRPSSASVRIRAPRVTRVPYTSVIENKDGMRF